MPRIIIRDGETLENALRRFKRDVDRSGVLRAVRNKEFYEKPSVKKKKRAEMAKKKNR